MTSRLIAVLVFISCFSVLARAEQGQRELIKRQGEKPRYLKASIEGIRRLSAKYADRQHVKRVDVTDALVKAEGSHQAKGNRSKKRMNIVSKDLAPRVFRNQIRDIRIVEIDAKERRSK